MPTAIRMQEKYGDDLAVLFVEVQGGTDKTVQQFAARKKWLGGKAMWTTEPPFATGLSAIPSFVLLSTEGEVVLKGYSTRMMGEIDDAVEQQVKLRRKGPRGLPAPVAKAWAEFAKGNVAKAVASAEKALAKPGSRAPEVTVAAAQAALDAFRARTGRRLEQARWMVANGYVQQASEQVDRMTKALKSQEEMLAPWVGLRQRLDSDELKPERVAAKALARLEKKLYDKGPDRGLAKALLALCDDHEGTAVARRAEFLATVAAEG